MLNIKKRSLWLSAASQVNIYTDVLRRRDIEACGLLIGTREEDSWRITSAHPLRNAVPSSIYFEFEPEELLGAELQYNESLVGVYHSHPTGYPRPSDTDKANMLRVNHEQHIPWCWLIVLGPFSSPFIHDTRAIHSLPPSQLLAFHHYRASGLQSLKIQVEYARDAFQRAE